MKQLLFTVIFAALSICELSACMIPPSMSTAHFSQDIREKADIVFFGKLSDLQITSEGGQLATFTVIKSYKGGISGNTLVRNESFSSCYRPFETLHSAYYIFATRVAKSDEYEITTSGSTGFISLENAIKYSWDIK